MTIELSQRIAFLERIHLFHGLSDEQLTNIARALEEVHFPANTTIFEQGQPANTFYLIYHGKVRVARREKETEQPLAILVRGDYFGERVFQRPGTPRSATATTVDSVILFTLTRRDLDVLLKRDPKFKKNVEVSVESRRMAYQMRFKWVRDDEVVYFLARKHPIMLVRALLLPALLAALILLLFAFAQAGQDGTQMWVSGVLLFLIALWAIWGWIDWGNDYYIVTNQRVIWLEKVIFIYDSSVESPLSAIRTEHVETGLIGRFLDYGNVIVYTFIGRIVFHNVPHPNEAAAFIAERRERAKEFAREAEVETMKRAIRSRLFPEQETAIPATPPTPPAPTPPTPPRRRGGLGDLFKLRFEDRETITYRKHTFVLIKQAWMPALLCLMLIIPLLIGLAEWLSPSPDTGWGLFLPLGLVAFIAALGWMVYQYVDWRNDIFQVTPDQILDIDKTPLGREERKSAPLENILSTEYKRIGILQLLFNYGTVYITIGKEEQMAFEDVLDPADVQQDIESRRLASIAREEEAQLSAERERLADLFADYHRTYHRGAQEARHGESFLESDESGVD